MFNNSFYHFFFGFVAIIGIAFVVLLVAGYKNSQDLPEPVDNVAVPQ